MSLAEVRFGGRSWPVPPGVTVSFGRDAECDVLLPADEHLSRRAGTVVGHEDYLVVRNDSGTRALVLRPPVGEDRVVEPGAATTSLPFERFELVLAGYAGTPVVVEVICPARPDAPKPSDPVMTIEAAIDLNASQRRVLLALCEPLMTRRGPAARPATYGEIAQRLGLQPGYVRNVLKGIRDELAGHGLAELATESTTDKLARWAVRSGWVGREQLADLPEGTE